MYILSLNINRVFEDDVIVLSEFPVILINEDLSIIVDEIRSIITNNIMSISIINKIPIIDIRFAISLYYRDEENIRFHSFRVNINKIRETKTLIKNLNK